MKRNFCRPCCYRFRRLKYIPRLFSEYMLTFMVERPMKICVTNTFKLEGEVTSLSASSQGVVGDNREKWGDFREKLIAIN